MNAGRGTVVREQGRRRVSLVTRTTAVLSAAAAGVLGMVFAGHAPAATSTGADVGTAVTPSDAGAQQPVTAPSAQSEVQAPDPGSDQNDTSSTGSGTSGSDQPQPVVPTRSIPRHVAPRTVVTAPTRPVVRAPVTVPAPVITHRSTHSRSGGS